MQKLTDRVHIIHVYETCVHYAQLYSVTMYIQLVTCNLFCGFVTPDLCLVQDYYCGAESEFL